MEPQLWGNFHISTVGGNECSFRFPVPEVFESDRVELLLFEQSGRFGCVCAVVTVKSPDSSRINLPILRGEGSSST